MKLAYLAGAWLGGVLIGLETRTDTLPLLLLIGASIALGLALRVRRMPVFPAVLAVVLVLGVWRTDGSGAPVPLIPQAEAEASLQGRIIDDPEFSSRRVKFTMDVESADLGNGHTAFETRVLVYADPSPELVSRRVPPYFDYGDLVTVSGTLKRPQPFGDFDYPAFLASQGISATMFADSAAVTGESPGWRKWPYWLRGKLSDSINQTLPHPQSALAQALVLGKRDSLPPDMVQEFRGTGTSHLLAISGLHVGVLAAMFLVAATWLLGRRGLYFLAVPLVAVWVYALVSGLPPSVVRAAVMGTVYLAAVGFGRPASALPALALAVGVMTAISPEIIQRTSFQLSFAAVAGIGISRAIEPHWDAVPDGRDQPGWRTWSFHLFRVPLIGLIISRAAILATWPLLAFNFNEVALPGVVVTVLALPAMPLVMAGGLLTAVVGTFSADAGQFFGWLVWVPISYLIEIVQASPDWTVRTEWASRWLVLGWYLVLGAALLILSPWRVARLKDRFGSLSWARSGGATAPAKTVPVILGAAVMVIAAGFLWWQVGRGADGDLHVHFFDVGQGDSALIVTPQGRQVLVDGGPDVDSATRALARVMSDGDRSLDLVVLTHLDSDHSQGLLQVLERYDVGAVVYGAGAPESAMSARWDASVERNQVRAAPVFQGYRLDLGSGVTVEVLNPRPENPGDESGNNQAVVLRVAYGTVSFLLAADIEAEAEADLTYGPTGIRSTVLKAAHHGSKTSSTAPFISAVDPAAVLVSVGQDNPYGHPDPGVMLRLGAQTGAGNLYRTDLDGDVEFVTDGADLWVNTNR